MSKSILAILWMMFLIGPVFGETPTQKEEIVLTTYYPVPYGDYREMRSERMAVGPNWRSHANVCWEQGKCSNSLTSPDTTSLIVEGNVGIGTPNPASKLAVSGGLSVGTDSAYYSGQAPAGGMIVQGDVGIGTLSPVNKGSAGYVTTKDVYLQDVNRWASEAGQGELYGMCYNTIQAWGGPELGWPEGCSAISPAQCVYQASAWNNSCTCPAGYSLVVTGTSWSDYWWKQWTYFSCYKH